MVGVKGKVARVTDPGFLADTDQYDLYRMGIDLIINQKQECANEVFNMLMMPGAHEVFVEQPWAQRDDGAEDVWVLESQAQRSETAHGYSDDRQSRSLSNVS